MKRLLLAVLLLALLLCACGTDGGETTGPAITIAPGLYDPEFSLNTQGSDSLKAYPLDGMQISGMMPMGEDLLLFSAGEHGTRLYRLSGETLATAARTEVDCILSPDDLSVLANADGVMFYDGTDHALVTLNALLQEVSRVAMPEMDSTPAISSDGKTVYYTAGSQVRALDIQSGVSRLLREQNAVWMAIRGLYCEETMLEICAEGEDGKSRMLFLSTENGQVISQTEQLLYELETTAENFYAQVGDGASLELLYGSLEQEPGLLAPEGDVLWTEWLPRSHAAVSFSTGEKGWTMDRYDLETGLRTASVTVQEPGVCWYAMPAADDSGMWLLSYFGDISWEVLLRWDFAAAAVEDDRVYTSDRHSADAPDLEGLAACADAAAALGESYGVEILVYEEAVAVQPGDYTLNREYRVGAIEDALTALEGALAKMPEGFLAEVGESSDSDRLRIVLVQSIQGDPEKGTLDCAEGLQFWSEGDAVIALVTGENVAKGFYHELYHIIDSAVVTNTTQFDGWNSLNPKGFKYDYDYIENLSRTDTTYLEGDNRAFVDFYSMSYPKEDRARIFEHAMLEGMEELFSSDRMQNKLYRLCRGIRRAYGLSKYAEELPWEQYLEKSLVP